MKLYEGLFLADSRKANRDWESLAGHVRNVIEKCGGSVISLDKWAERKLAYPVKKHTRGVYVLTYFQTPDENETAVGDIQRQVEISDALLRAMILRIKSVPQKSAPAEAPPAEAAAPTGDPSDAGAAPSDADGAAAAEAPRPVEASGAGERP